MAGARARSLVAAAVTAAPAAADPVPDPSVILDRDGPHTSGPDNNTGYWANNSLTGYCGQTDGGYVLAARSYLYAWGLYTGAVDNYWGPRSHDALLRYQAERGELQRDGCAGPQTWQDMQLHADYVGRMFNCAGPGYLDVYYFEGAGGPAYFTRSPSPRYWYTDPSQQPRGSRVGAHLYRFSDNLVARC